MIGVGSCELAGHGSAPTPNNSIGIFSFQIWPLENSFRNRGHQKTKEIDPPRSELSRHICVVHTMLIFDSPTIHIINLKFRQVGEAPRAFIWATGDLYRPLRPELVCGMWQKRSSESVGGRKLGRSPRHRAIAICRTAAGAGACREAHWWFLTRRAAYRTPDLHE